ncbi:hypothetical protein T310_0023 [Rasamsonia emersonii CBS 393.64]|uniref:Uncharacterized protein n=1 Tax=Rasamsonia emersonii (strain ATCC 16479 / CBS 393.64 / IMI 116815) TaxID=1408163 RepID=A0A0F4Z5V4_RASE3|nr:hypothetical protein T310_0023 [Rasamsonia emersonii CBS 393.64]KKA25929.1 hypothetical protein T310_0023 [Rasamsonia emersonii CBS 393.64]
MRAYPVLIPSCCPLNFIELFQQDYSIRNAIRKQKRRRPDIPPGHCTPRPDLDKGIPPHRHIRRVDVTQVRNGQRNQVVPQHTRLRRAVHDAYPHEHQEQVDIAQLVRHSDGAGMERRWGRRHRGRLAREEILQVKDHARKAGDPAGRCHRIALPSVEVLSGRNVVWITAMMKGDNRTKSRSLKTLETEHGWPLEDTHKEIGSRTAKRM